MTASFPVSERNNVRRLHERGSYDRENVYAVLDAAMLCHIAYARFPVRQVVGEVETCLRMPAGVERPEGLAGFTPGRRLDEVMRENYRKTYAT